MAPPVTVEAPTATGDGSTSLTSLNPQSDDYSYKHLLPVADKEDYHHLFQAFEHIDPAARAIALPEHKQYTFLKNATRVHNLTPRIGTEVVGVDLTSLDAPDRDQLALEVARRGVMVFRDQPKFLAQSGDQFRDWGSYFGRPLIHPTAPHPPGIPEIHVIYHDTNASPSKVPSTRISTTIWHSDASYELQPPGLTTLFLLAQPSSGGGDTLFASQVQVLKQLSPLFVNFLRTLKAMHSPTSFVQHAQEALQDGSSRRALFEHGKRHPATGEEALYVNEHYTKHLVGLKQEESRAILDLLFNHIARAADAHVRVKWEANTVVIWDNRVASHTRIRDFSDSGEVRHGARITAQAERPIPALESLELP